MLTLFRHDPGPCPVDDAPHTTCTSPDYDPLTGRSVPIVTVQLPARDGARTPRSRQTYGTEHGAITTGNYTRAAWRAAVKWATGK